MDRKFKKISSSGHRSPINIVSGRQSHAEAGLGSPGLRSSLASSHMRIRQSHTSVNRRTQVSQPRQGSQPRNEIDATVSQEAHEEEREPDSVRRSLERKLKVSLSSMTVQENDNVVKTDR